MNVINLNTDISLQKVICKGQYKCSYFEVENLTVLQTIDIPKGILLKLENLMELSWFCARNDGRTFQK